MEEKTPDEKDVLAKGRETCKEEEVDAYESNKGHPGLIHPFPMHSHPQPQHQLILHMQLVHPYLVNMFKKYVDFLEIPHTCVAVVLSAGKIYMIYIFA